MDNIWADSFSEIRELSLQEKKEEKKEGKPKRWWDDDGDGVGYEKGEVSGKFKKTKKEEFELWVNQLVEEGYDLSEYTWDEMYDIYEAEGSYGATPKAYSAASKTKMTAKRKPFLKKMQRRTNPANRTPDDSPRKGMTSDDRERARAGAAHGVGTRHDHDYPSQGAGGVTKNPKKLRKQKAMGEFSKEEFEIEEGMKQARKNVGASKCWDGYKAQGTKKKGGKEVPNCVPEERELSSKKNNGDQLDVMKGKNKIEINPKLSEEIQEWVGELIDEGYDLSQFTPDEIVDIYESAEVEQLDEQDQQQDSMASAKAKAARAKVAKERADYQVAQQAQRMKVSPSESVIAFIDGREPLFEARFDPKKTKLRPASERTAKSMTDAQRKAAKKESERVSAVHSKGETVLAGMRSSGKRGKVQTTPAPKSKAPEANRSVRGKSDKLASAADKILKDLRK
jgi:hypothetical protein